jgi:primosomal protein N' (replication factor Y)
VAKLRPEVSSSDLPVARVWVDSGVFHLDQHFDYLVPDNLSPLVKTGIRIQVPFHGREVEALVIARIAQSDSPGLKSISKVISPHSVATSESLSLIEAAAHRWAAHPYDILRSAIPPRVASVDKESFHVSDSNMSVGKVKRTYIQIPPVANRFDFIATLVRNSSIKGSTLIVVPDSRSAHYLHLLVKGSLLLDSTLERSERYRNFLQIRNGRDLIVIGTRSAIFAPIADLSSIVVIDEGSESHYEPRTPGWNVRDVAILRSMQANLSLSFVGYSPSSEAARLIETKWMDYSAVKSRINVAAFAQTHGELLPSRLMSEIRKAMKVGPILFLSPRKGYSQAITCSKCRNVALCSCGGKLTQKSNQSAVQCVICAQSVAEWKCTWCQGTTPFLLGRGSERFAYEIGAAFAGTTIVQSSAENMIDRFEEKNGFVIATPVATPLAVNGYAMVIILEGERFFTQSDIRAHERSRETFFSTAAMASEKGSVALVMASDHPIIGAIASWKPSLISQRELRERLEVHLPPFTRAITLDIDSSESQSLLRGLKKSQEDGRLPASTTILGPSQLKADVDRIVVLTPLVDGEELVSLLHEFQRRRSSSKKTLASIRIDPYSLSR